MNLISATLFEISRQCKNIKTPISYVLILWYVKSDFKKHCLQPFFSKDTIVFELLAILNLSD